MAQKQIPQPKLSSTKLNFSFEYYDCSRYDYCLSKWEENQIRKTLERLKDISQKSFNDLKSEGRVYHFGQVHWDRTTEKNGFPNQAKYLEPFHFALIGVNGQLARVYGGLSGGTFYIVWFDLEHKIWPSPLRHT